MQQIWRFRLTNSSYMLSLSRANEYTWTSDLRYHVQFTMSVENIKELETWIVENVSTLPFLGQHKKIEWCRAGFAVDCKDDLVLLLTTYSEYVNYVIDVINKNVVYGETFGKTSSLMR